MKPFPRDDQRKLPGTAIHASLLYLHAQGLDASALCEELALDTRQLASPLSTVEAWESLQFAQRAGALFGDPYIHIRAALHAPLGTYHLLDYLMVSAPTLAKGFARFARFAAILHQGMSFDFGATGDGKILVQFIDHTAHMLPYEREATLTALAQRACIMTGIKECVRALHLIESSHDPDLLADILPFPLTCEPAGFEGIVFDEVHWHAPSLHTDLHLGKLLESMAVDAMPAGMKLTEQLKALLHERLPQLGQNMESAARELGMSSRSLQRHLKQDGTSYTELLEQVRQSVARRLIYHKDLSTAEIGDRLGFQEQSSVTRAFKRWFGKTPRQLREQLERERDEQ